MKTRHLLTEADLLDAIEAAEPKPRVEKAPGAIAPIAVPARFGLQIHAFSITVHERFEAISNQPADW